MLLFCPFSGGFCRLSLEDGELKVKFLVLSLGLSLSVGLFYVGVSGLASLSQKIWSFYSEGLVLGKNHLVGGRLSNPQVGAVLNPGNGAGIPGFM